MSDCTYKFVNKVMSLNTFIYRLLQQICLIRTINWERAAVRTRAKQSLLQAKTK